MKLRDNTINILRLTLRNYGKTIGNKSPVFFFFFFFLFVFFLLLFCLFVFLSVKFYDIFTVLALKLALKPWRE